MTDLFDDALFRAGACTAAAKALEPAILADVKITRAMLNDAMIGGFKQIETPRSERELNPEAVVGRETAR